MSDLVRNTEDRFSHNEAHLKQGQRLNSHCYWNFFFFLLKVLVNIFSVMLGRSHHFPGIYQYFGEFKVSCSGHYTAVVGFEPWTFRSGVRRSTTEPPRLPTGILILIKKATEPVCLYPCKGIYEPRHEKTNILHMRKQRRRSACGGREADQCLCFRYIDSTIPLLSKSEISSI